MKFIYKAYGIIFQSSFKLNLPHAPPVSCADVTIVEGKVPKELTDPNTVFGLWQTADDCFLFDDPENCRILVENGDTITVEAAPASDLQMVLTYIAGPALAALLQQRRFLTLRTSSIMMGGGAVLFAGSPGAGKSAILAKMNERGYPAISDGLSAVTIDPNGKAIILSSMNRALIRGDCFSSLEIAADIEAQEVGKREVLLEKVHRQAEEILKIYVLNEHNQPFVELLNTTGQSSVQAISRATFGPHFYHGMGHAPSHFNIILNLAKSVPVGWLHRPIKPLNLDMLADYIEEDMAVQCGSC